jgi:uncharacterized protein (UPF0179 family)
MDKFNDNFNDKSSFDVKNAEAPFNCSFKMKIQSKRKKFEHVCTASGSGRNYKCDLVPGSEIYDCTIIPSSVPIVVANQQISVFQQVKPASPCFAKLLKGKDSHRLL